MRDIYKLENNRFIVKICSMGATLLSFFDKHLGHDLTLGFDNVDDYYNNPAFFGAIVGRCANRIEKGSFSLNNVEYHTLINNGPNTLHNGDVPFSFQEFKLKELSDTHVVLSYYSKDGESGFPGNLSFEVKYFLVNNSLEISFKGLSDKDTIFNVTNHTYFNLSGCKENILNTYMYIPSEYYQPIDENTLALPIKKETTGSFDFKEYRKIGDNLALNDENLSNGGIDHNYVFESLDDKLLCSLKNEKIKLSLYSDLPGLQVYTSNFLEEKAYRDNIIYKKFQGVALEPQFSPNSINNELFLKPIIKANSKVEHYIKYVVEDL